MFNAASWELITTAFMTGKLKISGNMGLAMKLEQMIGKVRSKL